MKAYSQILLTILALALGGAVVVAALFIGAYYYVTPGLPAAAELRDIKIQVPLQVYSRDGRLIDEFGEMKRTPVAYDGIPPLLVRAVLAAEDEHFFEHPGVDYRGVIRGAVNELRSGSDTSRRQHDHSTGHAHAERADTRGIELRVRAVRRQVQRDDSRLPDRTRVHEGRDSRALFEHVVLRSTILWCRDRCADVLRQDPRRAHHWRDRHSGRHPPAANGLEPACQRRTRHRAPRICASTHERNRRHRRPAVLHGGCGARRRQAVWCAAAARSVLRGGDGSSRDGRALRHAGYDGRAQSHDHHRQPSASSGQSCHPRNVDGLRRAARLPWADRGRRAARRRRRGGVAGAGGNHSRAVARVARRLPDAARLRERDRASR